MRSGTPSDPDRRRIPLSRGPILVSEEGPEEAPVVLMVHGYPGSGRDFRWLAPILRTHLRVIRLDMPGMGQTPLETGAGSSVKERADVVLELIEVMNLRDFCILGHSMGGAIVADVANRSSDRIRALVLLSSIGLRPHRALRRTFPGATWQILRIPLLGVLFWPLVRWAYHRFGFSRSLTDGELRHALRCAAELEFGEVESCFRTSRVPTMSAWAEDDAMIEASIYRELDPVLPQGPRLSFDSGGHNIQKTRAREIGDSLISWLRDSCGLAIDPFP